MQEFSGVIYFHVKNTLQMNDYRHYQLISLLLYQILFLPRCMGQGIIITRGIPQAPTSQYLYYTESLSDNLSAISKVAIWV